MEIKSIYSRWILDSRGNPTVECDITLENGSFGRASVPSGASTGSLEALELRDAGTEFGGKGVKTAVSNILELATPALIGMPADNQRAIDEKLMEIDGTENKSKLGANAILAISLAICKAAARSKKMPLWKYISEMAETTPSLPVPLVNVFNGGAHADFATDIQEYMIVPHGPEEFSEKLRLVSEVYHELAKILKEENYPTTLGDEGGYAPKVRNGNLEPLFLISKAIEKAGYKLGEDVSFALDVAASELYKDGWYELKADGKKLSNGEMAKWYLDLSHQLPLISVEDGLGEKDWAGWTEMTALLGKNIQLVGDDLLVTNTKLLQKAIDEKACNAILIKLNQIGSLTETIDAFKLARANDFNTIISHRSGETEDTFIAHLVVGLGAGQIKTGAPARGERTVKYNEILRIAEQMSNDEQTAEQPEI